MERIDNVLGYEKSRRIIQDSSEFSFSIDSTILSFFAPITSRMDGIIDLGTGNGIIPLLLSYRTDKKIIGIDIQDSVLDRAKRSVSLNALDGKIKIIKCDIKKVNEFFKKDSFSLVLSNPPYFRLVDSKDKNDNETVRNSRHETLITMDEIIKSAHYLLRDGGSFSMVQRTERFIETLDSLKAHHLIPKRVRFIYPKEGKDSHIFLIDARKNGKVQGFEILEPLYIYDKDGEYTKEIKDIFHYKEEIDE